MRRRRRTRLVLVWRERGGVGASHYQRKDADAVIHLRVPRPCSFFLNLRVSVVNFFSEQVSYQSMISIQRVWNFFFYSMKSKKILHRLFFTELQIWKKNWKKKNNMKSYKSIWWLIKSTHCLYLLRFAELMVRGNEKCKDDMKFFHVKSF